MPYLDKDGLIALWAKIKDTFALKSHSHTASDLPTATTSASGCVQVGDGLSITSAGVLSATGGSSAVSGVKGNAESSYRTGNVNLTAANIGAIPTTGGTATGCLTIERATSGDTAFFARNTASGKGVYFGIGSGTYNRGVYDLSSSKWLLYADENNAVHVASHTHDAENITSGTLSAARGGTGQTTLQATRNAMGLGNTTGALPIANGGTGATTAANARSNLGITCSNLGINDYVTAQGSSSGWYYRKWNSGKKECWRMYSFTTGTMTASGDIYYYEAALPAYPWTWSSLQNLQLTAYCQYPMWCAENSTNRTTSHLGNITVFRTSAANSKTVYVMMYAWGW